MGLFIIICYGILTGMAIIGFLRGMIRVLTPIVSGLLSIILMLLLKNWAFGFLFRWAFFQGEHILARIVVVLLFFILGLLLFRWVIKALDLLTRLPVLHGFNRILGAAAGAFIGIMIIWLMMFFVSGFPYVTWFQNAYSQITTNTFLMFLYDHNFVRFLMELFTEMAV